MKLSEVRTFLSSSVFLNMNLTDTQQQSIIQLGLIELNKIFYLNLERKTFTRETANGDIKRINNCLKILQIFDMYGTEIGINNDNILSIYTLTPDTIEWGFVPVGESLEIIYLKDLLVDDSDTIYDLSFNDNTDLVEVPLFVLDCLVAFCIYQGNLMLNNANHNPAAISNLYARYMDSIRLTKQANSLTEVTMENPNRKDIKGYI